MQSTQHIYDRLFAVKFHYVYTLREPSVSFTAPRPHVTDFTNGDCVSS